MGEIEQMESESKSKDATVFIAKDILISNTIEHESELTNSRHRIKEGNTYKNKNIFQKEKTNKQSLKNISKNNINQDEAIASKDNHIALSFEAISNEEIFVQSRKIEASIQYKPVMQRLYRD